MDWIRRDVDHAEEIAGRRGFRRAMAAPGDRSHSAVRTEAKTQGRPIAFKPLKQDQPIGVSTLLISRNSSQKRSRGTGIPAGADKKGANRTLSHSQIFLVPGELSENQTIKIANCISHNL
jgi:hypothetical protein